MELTKVLLAEKAYHVSTIYIGWNPWIIDTHSCQLALQCYAKQGLDSGPAILPLVLSLSLCNEWVTGITMRKARNSHTCSYRPGELTVDFCLGDESLGYFPSQFSVPTIQTSYHKLFKLQFPFPKWVFRKGFPILWFPHSPSFWFKYAEKALRTSVKCFQELGKKIILLWVPL